MLLFCAFRVYHAEAMKNLFEKYGEVLECQIIQDPVTKRSRLVSLWCVQLQTARALCTRADLCFRAMHRGFGFVTFRDQESVQDVLDAHEREPLTLDHKKVGWLFELWQSAKTNLLNEAMVMLPAFSNSLLLLNIP